MPSFLVTDKKVLYLDGSDKVAFYTMDGFWEDIVKTDNCFICGAEQGSKDFNNEHVIPDWILRKFNLYSETITLPNGAKRKYDRHKIPCCKDCNELMGAYYEKPISELLSKSYKDLKSELENKNLNKLLFEWMCFLFIKIHLADTHLRLYLDGRKSKGEKIGDIYLWEKFHHIYCMARRFFVNSEVEDHVYGSTFIFPITEEYEEENFDLRDYSVGRVIMIKNNDYVIISVLDDSKFSISPFFSYLKKIGRNKLNWWQVVDVFSHLAFINSNFKNPPVYKSKMSYEGRHLITAELPKTIHFVEEKDFKVTKGKLLRYYIESRYPDFPKEDLKNIELEKAQYILDEKGDFKN